jgi:hypothetical protein
LNGEQVKLQVFALRSRVVRRGLGLTPDSPYLGFGR